MLALALSLGVGPAEAATWQVEVTRTNNALAKATAAVQAGNQAQAVSALVGVRRHVLKANVAATQLVGAPPTDPESDDPPGPPAVIGVLKVDSRVSVGVASWFAKSNATLETPLDKALRTAQVRRATMMNKVIALPAEGKRSDYDDTMADTLSIFANEVKAIQTALSSPGLSSAAKTDLTSALARARSIKAKVDKVWGGGERPAPSTTS
jgi:hypothetical protein